MAVMIFSWHGNNLQNAPRNIFLLKLGKDAIIAIWRPFWIKINCSSENFFDPTIMFPTSINPEISIFIEIQEESCSMVISLSVPAYVRPSVTKSIFRTLFSNTWRYLVEILYVCLVQCMIQDWSSVSKSNDAYCNCTWVPVCSYMYQEISRKSLVATNWYPRTVTICILNFRNRAPVLVPISRVSDTQWWYITN